MTTTRLIATWTSGDHRPAREALADYAGEYAADYDLDAAERAYIDAINARLPEGAVLARNGDVYGLAESEKPADWWSDLDIEAVAESIDVAPILEAHPSSTGRPDA